MNRSVRIAARVVVALVLVAAAIAGLAAFGHEPQARLAAGPPGSVVGDSHGQRGARGDASGAIAGAAHTALVAAGGVYADGYVARARRDPSCTGLRVVRSGPNKYALGRCVSRAPQPSAPLAPRAPQPSAPLAPPRRLLAESYFASLIADDTCAGRDCNAVLAARGKRGPRWVLVGGRPGVRPRTVAECPRYRNISFATDRPDARDRLLRTIPKGTQVHWRYASRGGRWVMAHWTHGAPYAWAFIPRTCVPDPPTHSELALWHPGQPRPTQGRPIRILRPALPCASRLRCTAPR